MKPPRFRYERPEGLDEALMLLAEHGDEARPLAGGQSLVPMLNMRLAAPGVVVDLNRLPGLEVLAREGGCLRVGALVRQRRLERWPEVQGVGALADGLPLVGHVATRNRGTVGGSVAHADPAAEIPVAFLALGGSVAVAAADGQRREVPADSLFAGFLATTLAPGELMVEVRLPAPEAGEGSALVEVAQRHGDFALALAAAWLRLVDGRVAAARVAVGAVADRPVLVPAAAEALVGAEPSAETARAAGQAATAAVDPIGSLHAPADYQRHLIGVLVARAVRRAAARADGAVSESMHPRNRGTRDTETGRAGEKHS